MADRLSPEYLHQRLRYEPSTGKLFWRHWPAHGALWNTRFAGKEAFTADNGKGYRQGMVDGRMLKAHRVIFAMVYGHWPAEIDHINRDRANNRIENLRDVSRVENMRNKSMYGRNTSGATGVDWHKQIGRWQARIGVEGRLVYLGLFDDFAAAVAARKAAEVEYGYGG